MKLLSFIAASLFGFSSITTTLAAKSFSASNLYYAAGLKDEQSEKLLKGLQSAGIKVLRVWLDGQIARLPRAGQKLTRSLQASPVNPKALPSTPTSLWKATLLNPGTTPS